MRRRLCALALAAASASAAGAARAEEDRQASWLARRIEAAVADATGGTMRIGRMDVAWTSLTATVGDVEISIPVEGAPPMTASIASGRVKLAWSGLTGIAGGQIHITSIEAKGATFSCSRQWIDGWRPRSTAKKRAVEIRVDHLEVQDGSAEYLDLAQKLDVHARGLSFSGDWSTSRRLVIGSTEFQASVEAPPFVQPWSAAVRGGVRVGSGRVEIFSATAHGPGADAELTGTVTWGAGASFTADGRAALEFGPLAPYLIGHAGLAGHAEGPVQIVFSGGAPIRVTAQVRTSGFKVGPVVTESALADLTVRPHGLDVAGLRARAYGGEFTGAVSLTFGKESRLTTDLVGRGVDLGRVTALTGRELPIAAVAGMTFKVEGNPAHLAGWTGGGTFDAVPAPGGGAARLPARGRGRLDFGDGAVRIVSDRIELGDAAFRLDMKAGLEAKPTPLSLVVDGTTEDAAATQRATLVLLDALGVPRNRFATEPISGSGDVRAELHTGEATQLDLGLDLHDGAWAGNGFDRAALDLGVDSGSVTIRSLAASRGTETVRGSAQLSGADASLLAVDLHARDVRLGRALTAALGTAPVDGRVDLDLKGTRADGVFAATGGVTGRGIIAGHEIADWVTSPLRVEGNLVVLEDIEVFGEAVSAHGRAVYDLGTREGSIDVDPLTIDLAASRTLADSGASALGRIEGRGTIALLPDGPHGSVALAASDARIEVERNGLREIELGDLTGNADLTPKGAAISVRAVPVSAWTFEAFLGFQPTVPISAVLYFEDLRLGAGSALGQSADLELKGQIQAEGELARPSALEINGAIDEAALRLGSRVLRSTAPFPLRLDAGRFALGPSRLEGDGARLELGANGTLDGAIGGRFAGTLDLGVASALWSDLRGSGGIDFEVALSGTIAAPSLEGKVGVHDGRLRLLGYRQTLEQIDAEAAISGETLSLTSFRALLGGGEVSATGRLTLDGLRPAGYHAEFSATNVAANYPEGFSGVYEGRLAVDGTRKGAAISGRIRVVRGLYSKDFDLNFIGGPRREFEGAEESAIPRDITLSVDVVSDGNVLLRNDVAKLEALGEVHVGGELARPEVTGRLSLVSGGTVRYRDVDYRLDYGTLDLTDRRKINPYVDIRGHTRVGEYEITLRVEGTMDHFDYELTSTPPLASQDIISLLVTGKTLDSISGSATASALPADMAAYYFAGLLSSTFGKQIQHSLGIDQLEVTPLLLKGQTDPTARVTIGKRVSDDVKIVFSQDIGTAQKQTYQVVWDATRRVRVLVESDTETGLGGEIQYSRQFGGARPAAARGAAAPAAGPDQPGTLRTVRVVDDQGLARPDLAKAAKLPPDRPFERGAMLAAGERIRLALVKAGRLQASVRSDATRDPGDGSYDVVFKAAPGPKTAVELITPTRKGAKAMRKSLAAFWRESAYTIDYWDQAAHALLVQLQRDGYYTADVTWEQVPASDGDGNVLRFHVDRGKPVKLRAVRFHGAVSLPRSRIDAQMASLQSSGLKKRLLRPEVLTADLAAVRALYRDEGYARVRVKPPVVTLAASGEAAEVDVTIEEGPRFVVHEIAFPADAPVGGDAMAGWIPLKKGGVFAPRLLAESEQTLRDHLDELGYPDVAVESRVTLDAATADVAFDVAAGGKMHVAAIAIEGNRVTKNRTISKALTFGVKDVVSRDDLLKSQQQLYRTGLFSSVRMTYAAVEDGDPSAQRVTVKVEEAPPLSFGLGVGYDSDDGPRASFLVGYSNLGGRNVGIAVQGLVSANQQRGQVTFRRRQLFGRATDSLLSLLYEKTVETGFSQKRNSVAIRFEQRPKPRWIRFVRYRLQQVNIFDITDPEASLDQIFEDHLSAVRLADIGVGLVRDTRDDAFAPTRGGYGSIETSVFSHVLGSQADFAKLFLRGSVTVSMKHGLRFASFLRVGAEQPYGGTAVVPLSERFFAGGSNTMRGFATDTVGGQRIPICLDQPAPIPPAPCVKEQSFNAGGEGLLLLNEELYYPIWKALKGELFLDAGNVYPSLADFDVTDIRSAAGLGLRLDTPIGPIRVEYGWKLDRKEGESAGEFVVAIGAVF